jgi:hypothetical protein
MKALSIPKKVNATVVRLVGGQVFLLSVLYFITRQPVIPAFLLIDFMVRSLGHPQFSLLAQGGVFLSGKLGMKNRPIFFAPKRFAASIGLVLSLTALSTSLAGLSLASLLVTGLLGFFSFLEAALGYCAGCKIFGFLMVKGILPDKYCEDCAW